MKSSVRLSFRLFLYVCLFCPFCLYGQTATAWALDPHAGLHGAFLQPAATSATPYAWDLNLGSVSGLIANDYVFARNTSGLALLRALRGEGESTIDDPNQSFELNGQAFTYGYPSGNRRFYARTGVDVMGPAISFRIGGSTRVGLFTRARALASSRGVDADLNYIPYFNTPTGVDIPVDAFQGTAAAWGEAGLHFSHSILLDADAELRLGGNFRYLLPAEGFNVYNPEGGSIRRVPGDSLVIINPQIEAGLTNAFLEREDGELAAGQGFAADLGLQYAWESLDDGIYRYTLGISLLDLGQLNFTNANVYRFNNSTEVLLVADDYDFSADGSTEAALDQLEQDINGIAAAARVMEPFSVGLPAAISAQFSFRPVEEIQLSVAYRGDVPGGTSRLSQGQAFTLAAHYSKWWFGGGLTAGMTEWQQVQVGAQLRLGPVFLGSDRLIGSVLPRAQLREGDFFVGLRLHDFGGEGGQKRGKHRGRSGKGSKVKCYSF